MKKQKNFKNQRGITLVALIITIIVLVILAAVAINVALNTGIINFASKGVTDYAEAGVDENRVMNKTIDFMTNTVDKIEGILGEQDIIVENKSHIEDLINLGLVDYWSLKGSLENKIANGQNLIFCQGNAPEFLEDGVYLQDSRLSTEENYSTENNYTMVIQAKELKPKSSNTYRINLLVGIGAEGTVIGSRVLGIMADMDFFGVSGAGDSYSITTNVYNENLDNSWHTFAIKWDGTTFSFFIDGEKMGTSRSSRCPANEKLYVGGLRTWGYCPGKYRNVMIFNTALDDEYIGTLGSMLNNDWNNL